jgi:hypothetical protein
MAPRPRKMHPPTWFIIYLGGQNGTPYVSNLYKEGAVAFLYLTLSSGNPVAINPFYIEMVEPAQGVANRTDITLTSGTTVRVQGAYTSLIPVIRLYASPTVPPITVRGPADLAGQPPPKANGV